MSLQFTMGVLASMNLMSDKEVGMRIQNLTAMVPREKAIVIYHANCLDGFGAAYCFHHLKEHIPYDLEFHPAQYGEEPPYKQLAGKHVFIVDFSYKRTQMIGIALQAASLVVLDHHKTSEKDLEGLEEAIREEERIKAAELGYNGVEEDDYVACFIHFNMNHSGTGLTWEYLTACYVPMNCVVKTPALLKNIEDRDLWKFELPNTKALMAALQSLPMTFESWDSVMHLGSYDGMVMLGQKLLDQHLHFVKMGIGSTKRMMNIGGSYVPVANLLGVFASDAGHLMSAEYAEGSLFAATYYDTVDGRVFSLRSQQNGADVSEIAAKYGGGGHKNAAGFKVPREHKLASV